jgi:hypothetical protein
MAVMPTPAAPYVHDADPRPGASRRASAFRAESFGFLDRVIDALTLFGGTPHEDGLRVLVQGVSAHERGHTWGLNHPDLPNGNHQVHDNLTMNSKTDACTTRSRRLGLGDIDGLKAKYS